MEREPYEYVTCLLESYNKFIGADNVRKLHLFRLHINQYYYNASTIDKIFAFV